MAGDGKHLKGRLHGVKNKSTRALEEILASDRDYKHLFKDGVFTGSACFMIEVMQDKTAQLQLRLRAAEMLAKYLNYAKPVLSETTFHAEDRSFNIVLKTKGEQKDGQM